MLGELEAKSGTVRLGHGVEPAYFSQHEAELDERGSVLDAAMSGTGLKRPEAQKLLGQFLFSGWDEHEKAVVVLSGGERRRLALAIAVASGANFLVLDEPTNHLDLESRESLERALEAFPGTVLLVSHDRALLDAVADRLLAVEDKKIVSYPGGWADYVRAQEEPPPVVAAPPKPKKAKAPRPRKAEPSALELVEREVARAESRVGELEAKLATDWGDMALLTAHREAREDLQALLSRWEALMEKT
jgi:ATP-binding cassette subfamily F protein 3